MRRLLASLTALGLLGMALGCNHTAGICDCDTTTHYAGCLTPMPAATGMKSEMLQVAPKEIGKDKGNPPMTELK